MLAVALLSCGFSLHSAPLHAAIPAAGKWPVVFMSDDSAWSSLDRNNGEPTGIVSKMVWKGPGIGLLTYMAEMKELWSAVAGDLRGYASVPDMTAIMKNAGDEMSEEDVAAMVSKIESVQGIQKRDSEGGSLVYFEHAPPGSNSLALVAASSTRLDQWL